MMWHTSNKRRPIIKNIGFVDWSLFYRFFECFIFFPPLNEGFFIFDGFASFSSSIFHSIIISLFGVNVELGVRDMNFMFFYKLP